MLGRCLAVALPQEAKRWTQSAAEYDRAGGEGRRWVARFHCPPAGAEAHSGAGYALRWSVQHRGCGVPTLLLGCNVGFYLVVVVGIP